MAKERQVNININYKVNTADIERSEQLLKRASQATDNLNKTTQNFAGRAPAAYNQGRTSIAAMRTDLERLKTQIEVTAASDTKRLQQLSAQYKALDSQIKQQTKLYLEQAKASKETAKNTMDLASQMGQVITAVKTFIAANVVKELVSMSLSMSELAGNIEGVERAFQRAFPNSVKLLNDLRAATKGTVSDFALMQRTLMATNLGVAPERLGILFEFAAARAQQTGESVDYLVDSIVRGIGRKSILILDNLGLSATRLKEEFNGASLASRSVAEVTEGVSRIAKVELEKMGGYAETAKTKVDQLTSSVEELKAAFAKKQEDQGNIVIDFSEWIVKGLTEIVKGEETLAKEEMKNRAARAAAAVVESKQFQSFKDNKAVQLDILFKEIIERQKLIKIREREIEQGEAQTKEMMNTIFVSSTEIEAVMARVEAQKQSKDVLEETIDILLRYVKQVRTTAEEEVESIGIIEAKRAEIEKLNDALAKATSKEQIIKIRFDIDKAEGELNELLEGDPVRGGNLRIAPKNIGEVPAKPKFVFTEEALKELQDSINNILLHKPIQAPIQPAEITKMDDWDKFVSALEERRQELQDIGFNMVNDQIQSILFAEVDAYSARIDAARSFYDEQLLLAGDNQRAKAELRIKEEREIDALQKKRADKEKKASLAGILINTALGITKAFATAVTVYDGIITAAIVAAEGASQYAIASRARYYAKGDIDIKGGTPGKDSIPAVLMPGESIMTTEETRTSKGIFKAVRAKKLNDRVLKEIVSGRSGGSSVNAFDDSRILKKLDEVKNNQPDLVEQNGRLYKEYKRSDTLKRRVRAKTRG